MGAFFTNLQVQAGAEQLEVVRAVLEADAREAGLRPTTDGEAPDRQVVLVPGEHWMTVYDQAASGQDHRVLERLATALSDRLDTAAFWVLVHDSDVLLLGLHRSGEAVDHYNSAPGYFDGDGERGPADPHVRAWQAAVDAPEEELRPVFDSEALFAEAALADLAGAIGLDPARIAVGYRYLDREELPADAVILSWRLEERPAWETPAEGRPRLETQWEHAARVWGTAMPAGAVHTTEVAIEAPVRLGVTTINSGGPGRGLRLVVTGDAPVTWSDAELLLGDPRQGALLEAPLQREGEAWIARFPDASLPAGRPAADHAEPMQALQARFAGQVHANAIGTASALGEGTATLELEPAAGRGTQQTLPVAVRSTEDRPLRAPATLPPAHLAPLQDRSFLCVLAVLEEPAQATGVVHALAPWLPDTGVVATVRFRRGPVRPAQQTRPAEGFATGPAWADLLEHLERDTAQVGVEWTREAWLRDPEAPRPPACLEVGTGILPPDDALPALALGIRTDAEGIEEAAVAALDALARDGALLQGLVTRWGHPPGIERTPYETACSIHGQHTTTRAWATRWLRGVGPGWLWLGPALRARLTSDPPGRAVGPALRIDVRDVRATEQALADLLPSTEDWQQAGQAVSEHADER